MAITTPRRSALVADRRPLERGLARFLLEEEGIFVAGEAATMADVLLQIQDLEPDLLVVHEKLVVGGDATVLGQIRAISPTTKIVLLAASAEALPAELVLMADSVIEDGPGLTQLGLAIAGPAAREEAEQQEAIAAGARVPAGSGRRWFDRIQGLAVASVVALAFLFARSVAMNAALSDEARGHITAARESIDQLTAAALATAPPDEIAGIAAAFIEERAKAAQAGADVSQLDAALFDQLDSAWPFLSDEARAILLSIFGHVYSDNGTPPPPAPTPSPPAPNPSPAPVVTTESPEPSASETPTVTDTPTESIAPSESPVTDTPAPTTDTPTPTTTETPPTTTETVTTTTETPTTTTETLTTTTETLTTTETPTTTTTETLTTTTETPTTETSTSEPPTTTETPSPTETPTSTEPLTTETISVSNAALSQAGKTSEGVVLIPPAIVILLLTGTGLARRRAVRDDEAPSDPAP